MLYHCIESWNKGPFPLFSLEPESSRKEMDIAYAKSLWTFAYLVFILFYFNNREIVNFPSNFYFCCTHLKKAHKSDACIFMKVPKLSDGQQNAENQKALPDVVGSKKQVSYKTEIIGGVPIVTQTQVKIPAVHHIENAFW